MSNSNDWHPPTQQFPPQQQYQDPYPQPYQEQPYQQPQQDWNQQPYQQYQQPYQQPMYQPAPEPQRSNAALYVIIGLLSAIVLGGIAFFALNATGVIGQPGKAPETPTIVVTETSTSMRPSTQPAPEPKAKPRDRQFGPGAPETSVTSKEFAENVGRDFAAYYKEHGDVPTTLRTYSPVTGKTYTMTCGPASGGYRCTGGNNASVFIAER